MIADDDSIHRSVDFGLSAGSRAAARDSRRFGIRGGVGGVKHCLVEGLSQRLVVEQDASLLYLA